VQDNPSFLGWIIEFYFISQLKACAQKSPASLTPTQVGGSDVTWPVHGVITFDPDKMLEIPLNVWLQPVKWNQESCDWPELSKMKEGGPGGQWTYLSFVQITMGQIHKANIQH
jgi:hypothetical protein